MTLAQIPLSKIDEHALPRDRDHMDAEEMEALRLSLIANGLRQPIEVFRLSEPRDDYEFGLISGLRRLTAMRDLACDPGGETKIDAFIREPKDMTAALEAMVEENAVRTDPSPWEQANFIRNTVREELFATLDEAIDALHPNSSKPKRRRIRYVAEVIEEIGGAVRDPHTWSLRQIEQVYFALFRGYGDVMRAALLEAWTLGAEEQYRRLKPYFTEAKERPAENPKRPGKPRRLTALERDVWLRRDRVDSGYRLWITGPQATDKVMDEIFEMVERRFGRG